MCRPSVVGVDRVSLYKEKQDSSATSAKNHFDLFDFLRRLKFVAVFTLRDCPIRGLAGTACPTFPPVAVGQAVPANPLMGQSLRAYPANRSRLPKSSRLRKSNGVSRIGSKAPFQGVFSVFSFCSSWAFSTIFLNSGVSRIGSNSRSIFR